MSNKERLKAFIDSYGTLPLLKDLSSIFSELGSDWAEAGYKNIAYAFSDSSNVIADVAERLERVDQKYTEVVGGATHEELVHKKAESEYNSLVAYFENLSLADLSKVYQKNKSEFVLKLKRLEYLARLLNKNNDKK